MTPNRHGSSVIEFPNELEIVTTREFDAPIGLVFDHAAHGEASENSGHDIQTFSLDDKGGEQDDSADARVAGSFDDRLS